MNRCFAFATLAVAWCSARPEARMPSSVCAATAVVAAKRAVLVNRAVVRAELRLRTELWLREFLLQQLLPRRCWLSDLFGISAACSRATRAAVLLRTLAVARRAAAASKAVAAKRAAVANRAVAAKDCGSFVLQRCCQRRCCLSGLTGRLRGMFTCHKSCCGCCEESCACEQSCGCSNKAAAAAVAASKPAVRSS